MGLGGRGNPVYAFQLSGGASAGKSISVTPTTSEQDVTFSLNDLPETELVGGRVEFCKLIGFRVAVSMVFDQAASGGAAVNADKLPKVIKHVQLESQPLGVPFAAKHSKGAPMAHFDQILANDYIDPQPNRAQLAAADGDTTVTYEMIVPVGLGCFAIPEDFAQPTVLYKPGTLTVNGFKSTVYDGDSTGAVIKTVTVRAEALYILDQDPTIGVPHQFVEYAPSGASDNPELTGFGSSRGIDASALDTTVAGLAAFAILTDATGIGLGGGDGNDNTLSIDIPDLRIRNHTDPRSFLRTMRLTAGHTRFGHIAGNGTSILHDAAGGLYTLASTPNDPQDAQAKFFPIVMPVSGQQSSKVHIWPAGRSMRVNLTTTTPAAQVFRSLELLRYSDRFKDQVMRYMGMPPEQGWRRRPKLAAPHVGAIDGVKALFLPEEIYRG